MSAANRDPKYLNLNAFSKFLSSQVIVGLCVCCAVHFPTFPLELSYPLKSPQNFEVFHICVFLNGESTHHALFCMEDRRYRNGVVNPRRSTSWFSQSTGWIQDGDWLWVSMSRVHSRSPSIWSDTVWRKLGLWSRGFSLVRIRSSIHSDLHAHEVLSSCGIWSHIPDVNRWIYKLSAPRPQL